MFVHAGEIGLGWKCLDVSFNNYDEDDSRMLLFERP